MNPTVSQSMVAIGEQDSFPAHQDEDLGCTTVHLIRVSRAKKNLDSTTKQKPSAPPTSLSLFTGE